MNVALTGVTGHLGAAVLRALQHAGYAVKVLVRGSDLRSIDGTSADVIRGDVLIPDSLDPLLEACDALIHCAAVISIDGDPDGMVSRTNIEGTQHVLEAAKRCGVRRVVHVSSIHVFSQYPQEEVLNEDRALVAEDAFAYDRSKRAGQEIALSMHGRKMDVLVMNPTSIIGPYDFKPSRAGKAIIDIARGRQRVLIRGGFDFVDVRDVAQAIVNGLHKGEAGSCHLLSGRWYRLSDIARMLGEICGRRIRTVAVPAEIAEAGLPLMRMMSRLSGRDPVFTREALEAVRSGSRNVSNAKARQMLDYRPREFRETLSDTISWFRQKGYL